MVSSWIEAYWLSKIAVLSAYMKDLMESEAMIIDIATHSPHQKDESHMNCYPKEWIQFEIDSFFPTKHLLQGFKRWPKSKLLLFLGGPMRVISWNNKNIHHLQNLVTQTVLDHNASKLRTFLYDERTITPYKQR